MIERVKDPSSPSFFPPPLDLNIINDIQSNQKTTNVTELEGDLLQDGRVAMAENEERDDNEK